MEPLRPITLEDKQWMAECYRKAAFLGCEQSFGCGWLWREIYDVRVANWNGFTAVRTTYDGADSFLYPAGEGDEKKVMDEMVTMVKGEGLKVIFNSVDSDQRLRLEELYPNEFNFTERRNSFDYLYRSEDLIELAGKKFHAKRGHVSAFCRDYEFTFEAIDPDNVEECIAMNDEWCRRNGCYEDEGLAAESCTVGSALRHLDEIGLVGGLVRVAGEGVVAFSLGEKVSDRVMVVHAEKAFTDVRGAYAIINQQFAEHFGPGIEFLNREDDAGSEGLRKAKLSYHPAILLPKYQVAFSD